jgi:hypothetical protein
MLDNPLYNPGGYFTNIKAYDAITNHWTVIGEIVNLTKDGEYQSGLVQRYDVLIYNMNDFVAKGCIPITSNFSGNGVGEYATYKVGDAVIATALYGQYDNVVIMGAISLPGDMSLLMGKTTERSKMRQLQSDNTYAPQPLITPDRAQNPSANKMSISSTQMDKEGYRNPDMIKSSSDRFSLVNEQPLPNGLELDSGLGDKGTYYRGLEYKYVNGSYYHIVVADKEDECAKASKIAKVALDTVNKLRELNNSPRNSDSLITSVYRAEQHQKIYELALESAKKCNTNKLAASQATTAITKANESTPATKVDSDYKPTENKLEVNTSIARTSLSRDEVVKFISYNQWKNELPKDLEVAAIRTFYLKYGLPNLPTNNVVSQVLIDKILADPDYKKYKDGVK